MSQKITATNISKGLHEFLCKWLEAAKGDEFNKRFYGTGLCSETPPQHRRELKEALPYSNSVDELGGPTNLKDYPFNHGCGHQYHIEVHSDRVHTNPQRLAWVEGMLELPIRG